MAEGATNILISFLGSFQACVSVLLTLFYGLVISQFGLLEPNAARQISRTSVTVFLPALLVHNLGSQLHADTILRYIPILVWALLYNFISLALGKAISRIFKFPRWTIPAVTFNNTAAMPLLLIQSLDATGVLSSLLVSADDTTSRAILRARSYFLVNAVAGNALTFGTGPTQLKGYEEDPPGETANGQPDGQGVDRGSQQQRKARWQRNADIESQQTTDSGSEAGSNNSSSRDNEHTSLLPTPIVERGSNLRQRIGKRSRQSFQGLPAPLRRIIRSIYNFMNPPLGGAIVGIIIGLVPPLHHIFFNQSDQGGYFNAWLTQSIKNIGELFVTLQVIVVGIKLSLSLRKEKRGEDTGYLPWGPVVFITIVRFILWPAISISIIWALAVYTKLLGRDPMLWFVMMLMPVGPTALKLMALAEITSADAKEKMVISKFLAITYALSPLISFAIVGSLKAAEAAKARVISDPQTLKLRAHVAL